MAKKKNSKGPSKAEGEPAPVPTGPEGKITKEDILKKYQNVIRAVIRSRLDSARAKLESIADDETKRRLAKACGFGSFDEFQTKFDEVYTDFEKLGEDQASQVKLEKISDFVAGRMDEQGEIKNLEYEAGAALKEYENGFLGNIAVFFEEERVAARSQKRGAKAPPGPTEAISEELVRLKKDLEGKANEYKKARGYARGSRGYLAKLLGISKNVEESEEVKEARIKYLQAKNAHAKITTELSLKEYQDALESKRGTASEEELKEMRESLAVKLDSINRYHNIKADLDLQDGFIDETIEYYKTKGGFLGKAFGTYLDLYKNVYLKKVPPKVRAAISVVMMGGAVASVAGLFGVAGGYAAVAAVASRPVRFALAPLFPAMTYVGTGKAVEKGQRWWRAKKAEKKAAVAGGVIEQMKSGEVSVEDTMKNLMELLEKQNEEYGNELVKRGWSEDRCEQVRNILTMVVGARAAAVLMSGTEAVSSLFEGKGSMDGKITITLKGLESLGDTPPESVNLSPEDYEKLQKLSDVPAPEESKLELKPEVKEAPSVSEIKPEKVSGSEIKGHGGYRTLWGSAYNSIMEKPEEYSLDRSSGNLRGQARQMANDLMHGYAKKLGISYEQLNEIASTRVQKGDAFEIMKKPDGTFEYNYEGRAFDGIKPAPAGEIPQAEVSGKGAVVTSEVPEKKVNVPEQPSAKAAEAPKVSQAELKGQAAEKTTSEIPGMQELDANQKLAQQKYARAVQVEKDLAILHERKAAHLENVSWEAHQRQVLATRGLLNRIIEGAGVGNNVSFWEGSALKWYDQITKMEDYIAQDVSQMRGVEELNLNLSKLKELFLKLGRPDIGESNGDYLQRVMKNPKDIELINQIISRK